MNILVDTNRYTDFAKGVSEVVDSFLSAELIFIPFIVLAELRAGFRCGSMSLKNEMYLDRFLHNQKVRILFPDEGTTKVYAEVYAQLRRQGTPIPTNDIWIASLAIQYSLPLYTRDKHFSNIPNLLCE